MGIPFSIAIARLNTAQLMNATVDRPENRESALRTVSRYLNEPHPTAEAKGYRENLFRSVWTKS